MDQINSEILRQFEQQGLTINKAIAIAARLVKFPGRPISNDRIKELREKSKAPEGKLDKNKKPQKYSRDLESDWNAIDEQDPHYGLKEHAPVDIHHGFVLAATPSPASEHDTHDFQYRTVFSRHTKQPIKKVYADKGYHGEPNRSFLASNKIEDGIMRKDTTTAKFTRLNKLKDHMLEVYLKRFNRLIPRLTITLAV